MESNHTRIKTWRENVKMRANQLINRPTERCRVSAAITREVAQGHSGNYSKGYALLYFKGANMRGVVINLIRTISTSTTTLQRLLA